MQCSADIPGGRGCFFLKDLGLRGHRGRELGGEEGGEAAVRMYLLYERRINNDSNKETTSLRVG